MQPTYLHFLGSAVVGFALGAFMRFPGFALVAIVLAGSYALLVSGSTLSGAVASGLGALVSLQLGYGVAIVMRVLLRRSQ